MSPSMSTPSTSTLRGHDLITPAIREALPDIGGTEHISAERKVAYLKVFDPCSRWTWYAVEFDGGDILFGYVLSGLGPDCDEWGYFSLAELESTLNRRGIPLERDLHWTPGPIPELQEDRS